MKSAVLIVLVAASANAEPAAQVQADLGLAVVGLGYEQPLGDHLGLMGEAQIFGTYFLPWFDAGSNVKGFGGQVRGTWFRDASHHGLYATAYLRLDEVGGGKDDDHAFGFCGGGIAGWAFPAGPLDIRVGGGAQYMRYRHASIDIDTPFVELDLIVGWRLGSR